MPDFRTQPAEEEKLLAQKLLAQCEGSPAWASSKHTFFLTVSCVILTLVRAHVDRHRTPRTFLGQRAVLLVTVLFLVFSPAPLLAHPHVFIDARVQLDFDETHLQGFWAEWEFDRLFTSMIVLDFRVPREGEFSQEQIQAIEEGAFSNLQHYNYFVFVVHDGNRMPAGRVENFTAFMRDGKIVYRFFVPYRVELSSEYESVRIQMYDHTFFTDITFHETDPVRSSANNAIEKRVEVRRDQDNRISFDPTDTPGAREDVEYSGVTYPYELLIQLRRP